jgi:hypothetical protein
MSFLQKRMQLISPFLYLPIVRCLLLTTFDALVQDTNVRGNVILSAILCMHFGYARVQLSPVTANSFYSLYRVLVVFFIFPSVRSFLNNTIKSSGSNDQGCPNLH